MNVKIVKMGANNVLLAGYAPLVAIVRRKAVMLKDKLDELMLLIEERKRIYSSLAFLQDMMDTIEEETQNHDNKYLSAVIDLSAYLKKENVDLWNHLFPDYGPCCEDDELFMAKVHCLYKKEGCHYE